MEERPEINEHALYNGSFHCILRNVYLSKMEFFQNGRSVKVATVRKEFVCRDVPKKGDCTNTEQKHFILTHTV